MQVEKSLKKQYTVQARMVLKEASVGKTRIAYRVLGRGPALVFLHGVFSDGSMYDRFLRLLARHYTVYAPDLPFHGHSSPARISSADEMAEIIVRWCTQLRIRRPVLCGHSAGGLIAALCAARMPCRRLVLIDTAGFVRFSTVTGMLCAFSVNLKCVRSIRANSASNAVKNTLRSCFWKTIRDGIGKDLTLVLRGVRCPVELIWGDVDGLFPVDQIRTLAGRRKMVIVKGAHDWPLLEPDQIAPMLPFAGTLSSPRT